MGWRRDLELELEMAVADALRGGPANDRATREAERNMRVILDRWLAHGKMPGIKDYSLLVMGGQGLSVDLSFEELDLVSEVNVTVDPPEG